MKLWFCEEPSSLLCYPNLANEVLRTFGGRFFVDIDRARCGLRDGFSRRFAFKVSWIIISDHDRDDDDDVDDALQVCRSHTASSFVSPASSLD